MKLIRDRSEARWLPSRHRYAIGRLAGFVRTRRAKPSRQPGLLLPLDRDQTAAEIHAVALWVVITLSCYATEMLSRRWSPAAAAAAGIVAAIMALQIAVVASGSIVMPLWNAVSGRRSTNNIEANSAVILSAMLGASVYFATLPGWVRFVAWTALGIAIVNAAAAVALWMIRGSVEELERRCGA